MASTRQSFLHENLLEGMDYSLPAHLIGQKWRVQHNMRLTPQLEQVPRKMSHSVVGVEEIRNIAILPSGKPGYGRTILFGEAAIKYLSGGTVISGLATDSTFRKWAIAQYSQSLYFTNDLNQVRQLHSGNVVLLGSDAPKGRYITVWFDRLVVAHVTGSDRQYRPSTLLTSDLNKFDAWTPTRVNEADYYNFVEWEQSDYPYLGITGLGKLHGLLWVYTPTAIIPLQYVGLPKVFQVLDSRIITRVGNTFPYTLVTLDTVHFFYDGIEQMFWAFDGQQLTPIGDPIRRYVATELHGSIPFASKMFGYVDSDNREIWWPFVSRASSGDFDKAVVFNYRYRKWYTASVENVTSFCGGTKPSKSVGQLTGSAGALTGATGVLGLTETGIPRLFGSGDGEVLREAAAADYPGADILTADDPVLESADYHYGDIRTQKETDLVFLNATASSTLDAITVASFGAATLPNVGNDVNFTTVVGMPYLWTPAVGDVHLRNGGQTLLQAGGPQTFIAATTTTIINTTAATGNIKRQFSVEVSVRGRDFLGDNITWASSDRVGYWTPLLPDAALDFIPKTGRAMRFRFVGKHCANLIVSAFSEAVRVKGAEK